MDNKVTQEIIKGLRSLPMYLPFWYHYDEKGSLLNDQLIEQSGWYYFHRHEIKLLQSAFESIMTHMKTPIVLVDLGSGNAVKTRVFIDHLLNKEQLRLYVPVDISKEYLFKTVKELQSEYGSSFNILPFGCHYFEALAEIRKYQERKLFVWFGTLQCLSYKDQILYLKEISGAMEYDDHLLITVDITDHSLKRVVELAYLDPEGYGGRFQMNIIHRLNREYNGNIDTAKFDLKIEFDAHKSVNVCSYFKVWMEALDKCAFDIDGLNLRMQFQKGDKLFLHEGEGYSCKYTIEQIKHICKQASLEIEDHWRNEFVARLLLKRN